MRLSSLTTVNALKGDRARLSKKIDDVEAGRFSVVVCGEVPEGEPMRAVLKLPLLVELRANKWSVERELKAFGITLD